MADVKDTFPMAKRFNLDKWAPIANAFPKSYANERIYVPLEQCIKTVGAGDNCSTI